jgi:hypothetical protein
MSALPTSTNSSNQDGKIITKERIYELLSKYVRSHGSNWSRDHMKKWYHFVHKLRLTLGHRSQQARGSACGCCLTGPCFRIQIREGILHLILNQSKRPGDPFPIVFQDPVLIQVRVQLLLAWRKHRARKRARLAGISLPSGVVRCIFSFLLPINFTLS